VLNLSIGIPINSCAKMNMNCNKSQEKCQILFGFEQNGLEFGVIFDQGKSYSDKFVSNGNDGYFMRFVPFLQFFQAIAPSLI
jgi:hypothetical protein